MSIKKSNIINYLIALYDISNKIPAQGSQYQTEKYAIREGFVDDALCTRIAIVASSHSNWGAIAISTNDVYYYDNYAFKKLGELNDLTTMVKTYFILQQYNRFTDSNKIVNAGNYNQLYVKIEKIVKHICEPVYVN